MSFVIFTERGMNMKKTYLIVLTSVLLLLSACGNHTQAETEGSHFSYDNQQEWQQIAGEMQSPINIVPAEAKPFNNTKEKGNIVLDYDTAIMNIENNGHSIQVTDKGSATINGRYFELTQFHFHAQSEHTINGKNYPLEVHFVHKAQDGRLAVIAVFFEEGTENKGFQEVLNGVTNQTTAPIPDISDMIPSNKSYYHYIGSLTTPPLTENVEWYVLKTPVQVSRNQIETFKKLYDHNNRETQPLNGRTIVDYQE